MAIDLDQKLAPAVEHCEDADPENHTEKAFVWTFDVLANLITLYAMIFTSAWATGMPASAIAFIAARFPGEAGMSSWIATSSTVTSAVAVAIIGHMSDTLDRRSFLLFSCAAGGAGMLISGLATSLTMVIGGQVLNGLGIGCGFLSNPLMQEIVPKRKRPITTAFATVFASGSFIGAPIVEGVFIQKGIGGVLEGWRVGFYVGVGLNALVFALLVSFYHPMPRPNLEGLSVWRRAWRMDWFGVFLACSGITLFLVGINYGGNPHKWSSGTVLGTMIPGVLLLVVFGLWEWKGTSTGILPHAIFRDRNYTAALLIRLSGGFALYGCQAYLPQVAVYVFGTDGLVTAVWQLSANVSTVLGALTTAIILRFYKEVRWITVGLLSSLLLGAGLMMLLKPGINFAAWFFPTALMGLSMGSEGALLTIVAGLTTPNESIATAVCVSTAVGFLGGAIATTMYGQIFNSKVRDVLPSAISKAALDAGLPESSLPRLLSAFKGDSGEAMTSVPGATAGILEAVTRASRSAYAESFKYIWITLIAFCVVSMMGCWLFTSTTKYFTDEVAAPVVERGNQGARKKDIVEAE